MSDKLRMKKKVEVIDIPDPTVNREARLVVNDADLDLMIRLLTHIPQWRQPDHIIRQLKAEQKRLFHPRS